MSLPFVDRPPTQQELEKFRLVLSTYQDGTGQESQKDITLPGWRDFERTTAIAFDGTGLEGKQLFDVQIPDLDRPGVFTGISCKMRGVLPEVIKRGRFTLEVSNALSKFWNAIARYDLHQGNYQTAPELAGKAIINLLESWKKAESHNTPGGSIDLARSSYLVLSWDSSKRTYHLAQFPLEFPKPENLIWKVTGSERRPNSRLIGFREDGHMLFEWYGLAGGQLKYYPTVDGCLWQSEIFTLEPLPNMSDMYQGVKLKAAQYFPKQWTDLVGEDLTK